MQWSNFSSNNIALRLIILISSFNSFYCHAVNAFMPSARIVTGNWLKCTIACIKMPRPEHFTEPVGHRNLKFGIGTRNTRYSHVFMYRRQLSVYLTFDTYIRPNTFAKLQPLKRQSLWALFILTALVKLQAYNGLRTGYDTITKVIITPVLLCCKYLWLNNKIIN